MRSNAASSRFGLLFLSLPQKHELGHGCTVRSLCLFRFWNLLHWSTVFLFGGSVVIAKAVQVLGGFALFQFIADSILTLLHVKIIQVQQLTTFRRLFCLLFPCCPQIRYFEGTVIVIGLARRLGGASNVLRFCFCGRRLFRFSSGRLYRYDIFRIIIITIVSIRGTDSPQLRYVSSRKQAATVSE